MKNVEIVKALLSAGWAGVAVKGSGWFIIVADVGSDENYPFITLDGEEWSNTNDFGMEYKVWDLESNKEIIDVIDNKKVLTNS